MLTVYLSASYAQKQEMQRLAERLQHRERAYVTSRWLSEDDSAEHTPAFWKQCGEYDLQDIDKAEVFLLVVGVPTTGGGLFVELGYALARSKKICVVGFLRNSPFYWLDTVNRFDTLKQALEHLGLQEEAE